MSLGEITLKLVIGFLGLWVMTRLLGKKEISQLTPFDFISSLMLSELLGNTVYQKDVSILELLFALALWAVLSFLFEKLTQVVKRPRGLLNGKPSIIIRHGQVDMKELRRNGLEFDQLRMLLRKQSIFYMKEVAYAIFEADGTLSVMKKSAKESVKREDFNLPDQEVHLSYGLVEDGVILRHNLELIGKDEAWLRGELEKQERSLERVAFAEWKLDEGLFVLDHKDGSFDRPGSDMDD
ncbi:DUF421 domain-containing protein [Paenibacillus sp. CAA11]|uniref:DUF421 domain-containing protein n=1 Tax=Paenibacillus sp. CAA11 TaxID=1532905 RepID=UPI000D3C987F|nr:DUF421 domain-containing protein [Paenibacillus sp. CAA11]AWB43214.1 DUF421 domain-containing protein [Paenibacillus sp. CAA11]